MGFFKDNKKRLVEGAKVAALFVWAMALVITLAGILNGGEAFRIVSALIVTGINIYWIVKCAKKIRENFRTLYDDEG